MRFTIAAVLALASAVFAEDNGPTAGFNAITKPTKWEEVPAGETYEIVWEPTSEYGDKPVSIILVGGASQNTQTVLDTIASGIPSSDGSFSWKVDDSLGDLAVYGFKLELDEDPDIYQWSNPFKIKGGDDDHSGHSSSASASATASSISSHSSKPTSHPSHSESSSLSSSFVTSYSVSSNLSSTISAPSSATPTPTESTPVTTTADSTASSTSAAATGGAAAFAANGLAVFGGLAVAALAL